MDPTYEDLEQLHKPCQPKTTRSPTHRQALLLQQAQITKCYYKTYILPSSKPFASLKADDRMQNWGSGDWMCGACQHMNFKRRDQCQRCQYPRYGGPDPSTYTYNRTEALAGDWYCNAMNCGAHNYASRSHCYICGALKHMMGSEGCSVPGWKTGDWFCTSVGCGEHNYANRTACHKCKAPRDYGM